MARRKREREKKVDAVTKEEKEENSVTVHMHPHAQEEGREHSEKVRRKGERGGRNEFSSVLSPLMRASMRARESMMENYFKT